MEQKKRGGKGQESTVYVYMCVCVYVRACVRAWWCCLLLLLFHPRTRRNRLDYIYRLILAITLMHASSLESNTCYD